VPLTHSDTNHKTVARQWLPDKSRQTAAAHPRRRRAAKRRLAPADSRAGCRGPHRIP